ncbi:acyl carrier protein [Paenibacillaceae bacterium WGS1546]|uniref:acyl carrier protein n=1 Tax=Cohnella sp. WGS1546 TaxID=3366810 RepID=UPI00372D1289
MSSEDNRARIKRKLCEIMNIDEIGDDRAPLVDLGFNSMLAIRFVVELEIMFGLTVEDDELQLDNFSTVERIDSFVTRKTS